MNSLAGMPDRSLLPVLPRLLRSDFWGHFERVPICWKKDRPGVDFYGGIGAADSLIFLEVYADRGCPYLLRASASLW